MEQVIYVPQLEKSFSVEVSSGDTFKSQANRSIPNASPCCRTKLCQDKKCSKCGKEVKDSEVVEKIIEKKSGSFHVPVDKLKAIKEQVENSKQEFKVKAVLHKNFDIPADRIEGCKFTEPAKKRAKDYVELMELCKEHVLIAEATFKGNSFEVALKTQDNRIQLIKFAPEARMNKKPNMEGLQDLRMNPDIIKIESDILNKVAKDTYDFTLFEDERTKQVEDLIEKIALGEAEFPVETKVSEEVKTAKTEDAELERLKKLMAAAGVATA